MITGHDFIRLSNRWSALQPPNGDEAVWRTAIGRAYYGAFHIGSAFLTSLGIQFPKSADQRSIHSFVRMALSHSADSDIQRAASLLADLHEYRKDADYDLSAAQHGDQKTAQQCHHTANDILSLIRNCDASKHAVIKANIEAWQRIARIGR